MNTRNEIISDNPPVVHIYEVAAHNENGRLLEILTGQSAQRIIDDVDQAIADHIADLESQMEDSVMAGLTW